MSNRRNVPASALQKLIELSDAAETLSAKVIKSEEGISSARYRLTGSNTEQEYQDLRVALDEMTAALPALKKRCAAAQAINSDCRAWLEQLPSNAVLEPVTPKL